MYLHQHSIQRESDEVFYLIPPRSQDNYCHVCFPLAFGDQEGPHSVLLNLHNYSNSIFCTSSSVVWKKQKYFHSDIMLFHSRLHTSLETTFLGLLHIPESYCVLVVEFHVLSSVGAGSWGKEGGSLLTSEGPAAPGTHVPSDCTARRPSLPLER